MNAASARFVVANGQEIHYVLERKKVKNLNLRVREDGSVFVSANRNVPYEAIDAFVRQKASFILNAQARFRERGQRMLPPRQYVDGEMFYMQGHILRLQVTQAEKESITSDGIRIYLQVKDTDDLARKRRMMERFWNNQCKLVFGEVMDELYPRIQKYGAMRPTLKVRDMKTRWGSCLVQKNCVTINKRLLSAPRSCIEYVVLHELCHLIHPDHSPRFYALLSTLLPDWQEQKRLLNQSAADWFYVSE